MVGILKMKKFDILLTSDEVFNEPKIEIFMPTGVFAETNVKDLDQSFQDRFFKLDDDYQLIPEENWINLNKVEDILTFSEQMNHSLYEITGKGSKEKNNDVTKIESKNLDKLKHIEKIYGKTGNLIANTNLITSNLTKPVNFHLIANEYYFLLIVKKEKSSKLDIYYLNQKESKNKNINLDLAYMLLRRSVPSAISLFLYNNAIDKPEEDYRHFKIPKKNGKMRDIYEPNEKLSTISTKLKTHLSNIFENTENSFDRTNRINGAYMHAYRPGLSIKTNAEIHQDSDLTIKLDMYKMFDEITPENFKPVFKRFFWERKSRAFIRLFSTERKLNYVEDLNPSSKYISDDYTDYDKFNTFENFYKGLLPMFFRKDKNGEYKGLYTGNPAVPIIVNLIMRPFYRNFYNALLHFSIDKENSTTPNTQKEIIKFSTYADDITVSLKTKFFSEFEKKKLTPNNIINIFKYTLEKSDVKNLRLNEEKVTIFHNPTDRIITGVRLNNKKVTVSPRNVYTKVRYILHTFDKKMELKNKVISQYELEPIDTLSIVELIKENFGSTNTFFGKISFAQYIDEGGKWDRLFKKYDLDLKEFKSYVDSLQNTF